MTANSHCDMLFRFTRFTHQHFRRKRRWARNFLFDYGSQDKGVWW